MRLIISESERMTTLDVIESGGMTLIFPDWDLPPEKWYVEAFWFTAEFLGLELDREIDQDMDQAVYPEEIERLLNTTVAHDDWSWY